MILGIDPSLTSTGLCLWYKNSCHTVAIKSRPAKGISGRFDRYTKITMDVDKFLRDHAGTWIKDSYAFIEGYAFASQSAGHHEIVELGAMLRCYLIDNVDNVIEVAPTSLKKFVTGKGNAKKDTMIAHVRDKWGMLFETSDEADAYGLVKLGQAYCFPELCANQAQREVVAKLKGGLLQ